jgi:thiamine-monophosphate kinase
LRGLASAALDISDGLLADLTHLCEASQVGAALEAEQLPLAEGLEACLGAQAAQRAALSGGDDYELLVTLPPSHVSLARQRLAEQGIALSVIGQCTDTPGITGVAPLAESGWQHFRGGVQ